MATFPRVPRKPRATSQDLLTAQKLLDMGFLIAGQQPLPTPVLPVGSVIAYRFANTPTGYLYLDGTTINHDEYPELGALYGSVPGGTFSLDDWRDVPIWGDGVETVGDIVGSDEIDLSHTHDVTVGTDTAETPVITPKNVGLEGALTSTSALSATTDIKPRRAIGRWLIFAGR